MKTRKFGEEDPATGRKWGGSPVTHWRHLMRGVERGEIDIPCGTCSACCRAGVPVYEDDGTRIPLREDGSCSHLLPDGRCERHDTRPSQCRLYSCTMFSIAGVVTDSPVMNAAFAQWDWDLSSAADRAFAEEAREKEAQRAKEEQAEEP